MFLDKILSARRQRPAPDSEQIARWDRQARSMPPTRGFARALRAGASPRIIAEFKRASPSKGVLNADLDAASQARLYAEGGASALSVLTEPDFFRGSREDLEQARAACGLPVLRKDFLVEDWEILETRCWGADALLLIAAVLSPRDLAHKLRLCAEIGIDALVEVHTREEALAVAPLAPALVGINNRDLVSFRVDLEVTRDLLPLLPPTSIKIAESGFETPQELTRFAEVDAFLIGETLVRKENPAEALRWLRGIYPPEKEL